MKKTIFAAALLTAVISFSFPQNIQGNYEGDFLPYVGDTRESTSRGGFLLRNGEYELSISGGVPLGNLPY